MKTRLVYERVQQKAKSNLPAGHCREIGRIIVKWAFYEQFVQTLIWAVCFAPNPNGAAMGRLAVRECKPDDQLTLLASVCEVHGVTMDATIFKRIRKAAVKLNGDRNLVAHGIWTDPIDTEWCVQQTRGTWDDAPNGPAGKKKITPQGVPLSVADLHKITKELDALIKDAADLKRSLR